MATTNDSGFVSLLVGGSDIGPYLRVRWSSGALVVGGATDNDCIGVTIDYGVAAKYVTVKLFGAPGTFFFTAAGAIVAATTIYPAASGKVDDAVSGAVMGYIAAAAASTGDVFEAYPIR